jgi:hypothetical protein
VLRGGPRGAVEALYLLQLEEADRLRTDMREVLDELRAHHTRYQEMADQRRTADHQTLEAVASLTAIAKALESLARQADSMPDRVQAVLNSADVTEIHKKLADALALDIWARLGTHSDTEAKRFSDIATRIEKNVHATVKNLRDANAGKPILPPAKAGGSLKERLVGRAHRYYIHLLRLSGDVHPLAVTFASICVGLAAIAILIGQISRLSIGH